METNGFLEHIVSLFVTEMFTPESVIIKEGDVSMDMYYIAWGDCTVDIIDKKGKNQFAFRVLVEGDHFGEISMIYHCPRTATVNARNYTTVANLSF